MRKLFTIALALTVLPMLACSPLENQARDAAAALSGSIVAAQAKYQGSCTASPSQQITNLTATINGFNLAGTVSGGQGLTNALTAKLASVNADLSMSPPDTSGACATLNAFTNQVNAQRGNKLTIAQADSLLASANQLRTSIPCP